MKPQVARVRATDSLGRIGSVLAGGLLILSSCGGGGGGSSNSVAAIGGTLAVTPTTAFTVQGDVGGPFAPGMATYSISNPGTEPLDWSASKTETWLSLSTSGGTVQPGDSADLVISINASAAASLAAGTYTGQVLFLNEVDGSGTTVRTVSLTVGVSTDLVVSPLTNMTVASSVGGTLVPPDTTYTVANASGSPINWTASKSQSWISLSQTSGTLQAGGQTSITATVDPNVAGLLGPGHYSDTIVITNTTNGDGNTSRPVSLTIIEGNKTFNMTPSEGLVSNGPAGGPFAPDTYEFVFSNLGTQPSTWTASVSEPWVSLSATTGQVAPGGQTLLLLSINTSVANGLLPGSYSDNLIITVDNADDEARTIDLTVTGALQGLGTVPTSGFTSTGIEGGPFSPPSTTYTLTNHESSTMVWSASVDQSWLDLSSTGGSLSPGDSTTVTVSVDQGVAAGLSQGGYAGTIDIVNETNGLGSVTRSASLNVVSSSGSTATSLSQFGVTWTFDAPYPVGQFANGDWWVVGPVTIVDINPPSTSGGRTMNGSMVNPNPNNQSQSYDSSMYAQYAWPTSYQPANNAALDVSQSNPLVLQPNSSLISSISKTQAMLRPQLKSASVLTVLSAPAPAGSFRPPYCGNDKSIEFNVSQLDYTKLASLAPVGSTPPLATVEQWFERPWVDHIPDWIGRYHHPSENMPDYGREICDRLGIAGLMLNLNYTDAQKETLLIRLTQVGIDFFGIVEAGGLNNWPAGGGHHSGRKLPILFAGLVLNDFDMSNIGFDDRIAFNEDDQTFYVAETSPGVYNCGFGGYGPQDVGLPEWGNQHAKNKGQDDSTWFGNSYRTCCTANVWWGQVLVAYIMGARALWNHEPLFDYMDRYRSTAPTTGQAAWTISNTPFQLDMWDAYRSNY